MKTITTGLLEVGYLQAGPDDGTPIILAHGFPDDALTWNEVTMALAEKGFRTYAPYQRGFGPTKFQAQETMRSGQYTALAQDVIDFADALKIEKFLFVGHDWGAAAAYTLGALFPERVLGMVTLSVGYQGAASYREPLPIDQVRAYWYQWNFQIEKGRETLKTDQKAYCHKLWEVWAPAWDFDDETFEATASSFDTPDFVDVVLHSYRHRWHSVTGDPRYETLEERRVKETQIKVPTLLLHGEQDGASLVVSSEGKESHFDEFYERRVIEGVGHFIPREAPGAIVEAVLEINERITGAKGTGISAALYS